MYSATKVLAITKRTAEMCATQSLLGAAGLQLITATNMAAARVAIRSMEIRAVIVCMHSWTVAEREGLVREVGGIRPRLAVVMRCPGCVDSDDAAHRVGRLPEIVPLTQLIATIRPAQLDS